MSKIDETPQQVVERWARREMQAAATPAERELMALVTNSVASLFAPEQEPGQVTAQDWERIAGVAIEKTKPG